ncbi:hypothetical protein P691DRAFT_566693 [Macrolepiota fuliginosa MF-IS2]|uniref:Uncharacterized protein n=1 Tax=Macrolepiota fuliginosa MF-IS2 TaxID=1400762 RepID=A0A9P6BXJ5_9AGAR|nr:hypothetical protein P691DRAFT_566693 [Macrolepiota fuliginosa MF-IS2]
MNWCRGSRDAQPGYGRRGDRGRSNGSRRLRAERSNGGRKITWYFRTGTVSALSLAAAMYLPTQGRRESGNVRRETKIQDVNDACG